MNNLLPIQAELLAPLFFRFPTRMVLAYLQGHMGEGAADMLDSPRCGRISVGDFVFFAGDSGSECADNLLRSLPAGKRRCLIPQDEYWCRKIEFYYPARCAKTIRFAMQDGSTGFDMDKLTSFAQDLSREYELIPFDKALYDCSKKQAWSADFCALFPSYEDFAARGMGCAVLHEGELLAGATSYLVYDGGIEIQIASKPQHRNQGLATACGARLILSCLEKGIAPCWDAANVQSLGLAEKLGYRLDHSYAAYMLAL